MLTPTLLRQPDGSVCREDGKLRMWFASTDLPSSPSGDGLHTLHETTSDDGLAWTPPSPSQLSNAYAPTIIKENEIYHLWYTDVTAEPWCIRYAASRDGCHWEVAQTAVLRLDQAWEHSRLFYPTVLKVDEFYLMWYGSYHGASKTALGFAISEDGIRWQKHLNNPVFGPDAKRAWESHYTTSQSILQLPDGGWRIWYASRTKPPFVHKYFAIGTARWG